MAAFDVAVVGLGAMGSAALYHLARRGLRTVGVEQAEPGHEGGSSHGESRIIRLAQFENPAYTPLVARAYALWRDLEAEGGRQVIVDTGILEAGPPGSPIVEGSLAAARMHGLAHELLTSEETRRRYPAFDLPEDWTIVFQPGAGIVRADAAIGLHMAGARSAGADVRHGTKVVALEQQGRGVRLRLSSGDDIVAGAAIVAAGPWIADLAPELAPHLALTRQTLCWFAPVRPELTTPEQMPVFLTEDETDALYGFPDFAGTGVKAASHRLGRRVAHADEARQDAADADTAPVARGLARLAPAAAGPLIRARTCLYANTPDEEFVIDWAAGMPAVLLCSACSGHGFKFASVFGEILADLVQYGTKPPQIAAFGLSRFSSASANQEG